MTKPIATQQRTVVVGLGATGLSVARYLAAQGERFMVVDSRTDPPGLAELNRLLPGVRIELGAFEAATLARADRLVVSPGLALTDPLLRERAASGVPLTGDIQLFADAARAPIIAITGSNGKSTVTTLVGEMARAAGRTVAVGGNLGVPALDLLADDCDLYVVELSSFQLELVDNLAASVATVLNLSPDHLDRYADIGHYHAAKRRIFLGAKQRVINRDEALEQPLNAAAAGEQWSFGLGEPEANGFGIVEVGSEPWLVFQRDTFQRDTLLPVSQLAVRGRHNVANALAALTLGRAAGLPLAPMLAALKDFRGLPHRCQWVAKKHGIDWINDSKATNVGAAIAALEGLAGAAGNDLILIAGGQGKGQDFSALRHAARGRVRQAVLFGSDAQQLADALTGVCEVACVSSLTAAVNTAAEKARHGDKVVLSPACASLDQFDDFADRGEQFIRAVEGLL